MLLLLLEQRFDEYVAVPRLIVASATVPCAWEKGNA